MADLQARIDVIQLKIFCAPTTGAYLVGEVLRSTSCNPLAVILTLGVAFEWQLLARLLSEVGAHESSIAEGPRVINPGGQLDMVLVLPASTVQIGLPCHARVENRVLETLTSCLQGRRSTYDELIPHGVRSG